MDKLNSRWILMTVIAAIIFVAVWAFLEPKLERKFGDKT